eukprot:COSAG02_NODE_3070_length_7426_cov_22.244438_4_plen_230_part_00
MKLHRWFLCVANLGVCFAYDGRRTVSTGSDGRRVMAWSSSGGAARAAAQMSQPNASGLVDGIMGFCGGAWTQQPDGSVGVALNATEYAQCAPLLAATRGSAGGFQLCLGGVPEAAIANPHPAVASAVALGVQHGWSGYNIDDESSCAPRGSIANFTRWLTFIDALANGLHAHGMVLTADIQAITKPWGYQPSEELTAMLSASTIDRWINMDTCACNLSQMLTSHMIMSV